VISIVTLVLEDQVHHVSPVNMENSLIYKILVVNVTLIVKHVQEWNIMNV
jgi:hypothetical protein